MFFLFFLLFFVPFFDACVRKKRERQREER
jgi:hypothetical protein